MKKFIRRLFWTALMYGIAGTMVTIAFLVSLSFLALLLVIASMFLDMGSFDPLNILEVDLGGRILDAFITGIITGALACLLIILWNLHSFSAIRLVESIRGQQC